MSFVENDPFEDKKASTVEDGDRSAQMVGTLVALVPLGLVFLGFILVRIFG